MTTTTQIGCRLSCTSPRHAKPTNCIFIQMACLFLRQGWLNTLDRQRYSLPSAPHELTDVHDWLVSLPDSGERKLASHLSWDHMPILFFWAPSQGWLWHQQDSNSQSPSDKANTLLLLHSGAPHLFIFYAAYLLQVTREVGQNPSWPWRGRQSIVRLTCRQTAIHTHLHLLWEQFTVASRLAEETSTCTGRPCKLCKERL